MFYTEKLLRGNRNVSEANENCNRFCHQTKIKDSLVDAEFYIISNCADSVEQDIQTVIEYEKKKFPDEGIKIFVMHEKNPELTN
ncbi:hypothetical protein [uncultured Treponema sp.]|uniref:hypothetical protein n=1 Tax=uncultured Treponema sp. TaxID=162155 RepID=UPI002805FED2|nr:hypothetical protein [uncultured Treponema sp.]